MPPGHLRVLRVGHGPAQAAGSEGQTRAPQAACGAGGYSCVVLGYMRVVLGYPRVVLGYPRRTPLLMASCAARPTSVAAAPGQGDNRKPEPCSWASTPTRTRERFQMAPLLIMPCLPPGARLGGLWQWRGQGNLAGSGGRESWGRCPSPPSPGLSFPEDSTSGATVPLLSQGREAATTHAQPGAVSASLSPRSPSGRALPRSSLCSHLVSCPVCTALPGGGPRSLSAASAPTCWHMPCAGRCAGSRGSPGLREQDAPIPPGHPPAASDRKPRIRAEGYAGDWLVPRTGKAWVTSKLCG